MDPKNWQLPAKRREVGAADRSVSWNSSWLCYEHTLFGAVGHVAYSNSGEALACTATNHSLMLRVPQSSGAIWNDQNARQCHATRFRPDGKLVVQSIETRVVIKSLETAFERQLKGHTRDVMDSVFLTNQTIVSGSKDRTVRLWDLVSEKEVNIGSVHEDYVKGISVHGASTFLSCSYDRTVCLWDARVGLDKPLHRRTLANQCEAVLATRQGQILVANGDLLTALDSRQLVNVLHEASNHTKPLTGLAYCNSSGVLLTSSFDQRVKFIDVRRNYAVVATKKFNFPVNSVAVHPHGDEFAVGGAAGQLQVFKTKPDEDEKDEEALIGVLATKTIANKEDRQRAAVESKLEHIRKLLISYKYQLALKTALYSRMPDVILSVLNELQRRGCLRVALNGHTDRTIVQLLRFAIEHIDSPSYGDVVFVTLDAILEIYSVAAGRSEFFHRELRKAHAKLGECVQAMQDLKSSVALMDLVSDF